MKCLHVSEDGNYVRLLLLALYFRCLKVNTGVQPYLLLLPCSFTPAGRTPGLSTRGSIE